MHGTIDHKAARGPSPVGAAQSTRDPYARTQVVLFRERSMSPQRDWNEKGFGERRTIRGRSSARAMVTLTMQYALERQSLKNRREVLGVRHPETIAFMMELSTKWFEQGQFFGELEPLAVQIMELRKEMLGLKHPDTLSAMADMQILLIERGRYHEAETLGKEVVLWREETLGKEHPDTMVSAAKLATAWNRLARYTEAENEMKTGLALCERTLGRVHPTSVEVMVELADAYSFLGRYQEAELLESQILQIKQQIMGLENKRDRKSTRLNSSHWE